MKESRQEKKKAQTKERIFQTALRLFLTQGFEKTTVEQIISEADIAKGTFFNHFPAKDAVLFYLGEQRVALLDALWEQTMGRCLNAREKIYAWLQSFAEANEKDREIIALVVRETFRMEMTSWTPEWQNQKSLKERLAEVIQDGQEKGDFRPGFRSGQAADVFVAMYFSTLFQWLENKLDCSLADALKERAEIIISGLERGTSWKS